MQERKAHTTVLLKQAVNALVVDRDGVYVDCTFGRGGHSSAILDELAPQATVIALDRDPEAVEAGLSLAKTEPRFSLVQGRFSGLKTLVESLGLAGRISGVLFDLGVSSPQLDKAERGFSFLHEGPLDMRMDATTGPTAAEWLNSASERQIADVLFLYGEEKFSRRMARAIVAARLDQPITTTSQLADIVTAANPAWERDRHPATRAFQAIRIFINRELEELTEGIKQAESLLRPGGRLVVISFHSLEDRIVKKFITLQIKGDNFPKALPIPASMLRPTLKSIGKPIRADEAEIQHNPRARSAIMRVAEKIA
ncbi:MAG: 16S rRNA (cytosine(1402)-N(4))-methyltransferase RsmH [Pseudohongiellaceae bacterium]